MKNLADNKFLKLLPREETVDIDNDEMLIGLANDVFKKVMFLEGNKTKMKLPDEYELISPANYAEMFTSLTDNLDEICFTQSQIIEYCRQCSNKFKPNNYAYLFLLKVNGIYYVANIRLYSVISKTLNVYVYPLFDENKDNKEGSNFVWESNEFPPHIFVPVK